MILQTLDQERNSNNLVKSKKNIKEGRIVLFGLFIYGSCFNMKDDKNDDKKSRTCH